jgi:hypothetical protein
MVSAPTFAGATSLRATSTIILGERARDEAPARFFAGSARIAVMRPRRRTSPVRKAPSSASVAAGSRKRANPIIFGDRGPACSLCGFLGGGRGPRLRGGRFFIGGDPSSRGRSTGQPRQKPGRRRRRRCRHQRTRRASVQQNQSLARRHPSRRQRRAPGALSPEMVLPVQSPQLARRFGRLPHPLRRRMHHHHLKTSPRPVSCQMRPSASAASRSCTPTLGKWDKCRSPSTPVRIGSLRLISKQTITKGQPSISIAPVIDSWILLLHVPRLTILN